MKKHYDIYPEKILIPLFIMGFLCEFYLFRNDHSLTRIPMIILLIVLMILTMKRFRFSNDQITVQYLIPGLCRTIPWSRVSSVEYVVHPRHRYLLITMDDTPCFMESGLRSVDTYTGSHPFRVIAIGMQQKSAKIHIPAILEFRPDIVFACYDLNREKYIPAPMTKVL